MPDRKPAISATIAKAPTWALEETFLHGVAEMEEYFYHIGKHLNPDLMAYYGLSADDRLAWITGSDMEIELFDQNGAPVELDIEENADSASSRTAQHITRQLRKTLKSSNMLFAESPISWETRPDSDVYAMEIRFTHTMPSALLRNKHIALNCLEKIAAQEGVTINVRSDHYHMDLRLNGVNIIDDINYGLPHPIARHQLAGLLHLFQHAPQLILAPRQIQGWNDSEDRLVTTHLRAIALGTDRTDRDHLVKYMQRYHDVSTHRLQIRRSQSHEYFHPALFMFSSLKALKHGLESKAALKPSNRLENIGYVTDQTKYIPLEELSHQAREFRKTLTTMCYYRANSGKVGFIHRHHFEHIRESNPPLLEAIQNTYIIDRKVHIRVKPDNRFANVSGILEIEPNLNLHYPAKSFNQKMASIKAHSYRHLLRLGQEESNPAHQILGNGIFASINSIYEAFQHKVRPPAGFKPQR